MKNFSKTILMLILVIAFTMGGVPTGLWASTAHSRMKAELSDLHDPAQSREWLEQKVRHELVMLPFYNVFDNLTFKVDGNRIELMGQVSRPSLRVDAERAVRNIEGVEGVSNHIEVLPTSFYDDRIRLAVYRAIYSQTALQPYALRAVPPIHIIVKNGNVNLEGVVAREFDKNVAFIRANGVPGVFSVTNSLRVES